MEKFDPNSWCEMFWSERNGSMLDFIGLEDFLSLCQMDAQLSARHKRDGTDPFAVSDTCREMGGLILLVRLRSLAIDFKCTEAVCAFIMQISRSPAKAVMYCYALDWKWQKSSKGPDVIPDMEWIAGVLDDSQSEPWSLPNEKHLTTMWELQKMDQHALFTDNHLDMATAERKVA